ncbi:MAG: hypothetical protein JWP74_557 [Marmoricola sp.]|nr:hypothetical protein [Marmoricola sp.]
MTAIKDFLLSRAMQDEAESDARQGRPSTRHHPPARHTELRAEIERHNDHSMTIVSRVGTETITRCGCCPKEDGQPCRALRLLALPYAQHPAYRAEWALA